MAASEPDMRLWRHAEGAMPSGIPEAVESLVEMRGLSWTGIHVSGCGLSVELRWPPGPPACNRCGRPLTGGRCHPCEAARNGNGECCEPVIDRWGDAPFGDE
jgi:hypothetical protein